MLKKNGKRKFPEVFFKMRQSKSSNIRLTTSSISEYESTQKMHKIEASATSEDCLKAICSNSKVWLSNSEQFRPTLCDETLENNQCLYDWIEK